MNLTLFIDPDIIQSAYYFSPHFGIHDSTNLGRLDSVVGLPDVAVSVFANYINEML